MKLRLTEDRSGPLHIVRLPREGQRYSMGVDSSEGVRGGDPCAIVVLDMDDLEEVAWFHQAVHPRVLAHKAWALGHFYNEAFMVVESNSYGHAVVWELLEMGYPHLYRDIVTTDIRRGITFRPGFRTDTSTRPKLWAKGRHVVNEGYGRINSEAQLREMMAIRYPEDFRGEPIPEHPKGGHDDLTVAWLLALWGRDAAFEREIVQEKKHVPESVHERFAEYLRTWEERNAENEWADEERLNHGE